MSIDTSSRVITRTTAALETGIPYILHQGGTSSGKTFGILYSLLFHALKKLKAGSIVTVVSETLPHLKKGAITDFKKNLALTKMEGHVMENKSDHVFILPNKTQFEFYSPDTEEKAKSGKRDLLFINEANGMSYAIAKQLIMRTNGPVILDWNPSGQFWFHTMYLPYINSSEYIFTRTTYRDNKFVDPKIIAEIERLRLINPSDYDIYGLGIEGKGTEIIYPNYELVDAFPETSRQGVGLDFGFTNDPAAAVRCAYSDGCLWYDELFYEKGLSNKKIFEQFETYKDYGPIIADSAEPKSIAELDALGLNIKAAVKGADSVKFGIDQIKEYPIRITRRSLNLINEIIAYKWKMKDGLPTNEPKGGNDHLMDAMRYGTQAILTRAIPLNVQVQRARNMGFTNMGI